MRSKYLLPLAFVLAASACGDDSSDEAGDGGTGDGGNRDASTTIPDGGLDSGSGVLQPGTFRVSNVQKIEDGCRITLEDGTLETLPLGNVAENGAAGGTRLYLGNRYDLTTDPSFDPPNYALGNGMYTTATTANLAVESHVELGDQGCEFDVSRTTVVTYTGPNMVSVDYTNRESNHTARCDIEYGFDVSNCTSHYTFTMTRTGP